LSKDNPDKSPDSPAAPVFDPERSRERFKEWFPLLSEAAIDSLITYLIELNKFNKAVNLVSPQTLPLADALHLADGVYALRYLQKELIPNEPLYDLGSGNGVPGLVMALVDPSLRVILVDRDERKLEFCKHVAAACGATNVTTMKAEIEQMPKHSVVNAVARGFAPLPKALLMARGLVAKGGKFFHLKGDQFAQELSLVPSQLFSYWQPRLLGKYRLPDRGAEMSVICTDKIAD
jgi:16S rRNA (guanine527-N7)-methyltransferase